MKYKNQAGGLDGKDLDNIHTLQGNPEAEVPEVPAKSPFPGQLMRPEEVVDLLAVSGRTLEAWRLSGAGPPYVRLGSKKAVRYKRSDVETWLAERTFRSTSEESA